MKQESRIKKQLKLRLEKIFKRKRKDDGVASSKVGSFAEPSGQFGKAEDLAHVWSLDSSDSNVSEYQIKRWPKVIIATTVFAAIMLVVFLVLPKVLPGFFKKTDIAIFVDEDPVLIYDDSYRVVKSYCTSVMQKADIKSQRITQLLMNEPVHLMEEESENGYVLVRSMDNIVGYVREDDLSSDMSSCEPELHQYKLVIADMSKRVMSHASSGTLIAEVMMNTVLYSDVKRDGVYQVTLPNGETGWISSSGVVELGLDEETANSGVRYFVSSALMMVNSTYLQGGLTKRGISMQGLVYVSASVNGVKLSREMDSQIQEGHPVQLEYDAVTRDLLLESIHPGDLVFLSDPYHPENKHPYEVAICTDTGVLLMRDQRGTSIKLRNFTAHSDLVKRIIEVRRVFS